MTSKTKLRPVIFKSFFQPTTSKEVARTGATFGAFLIAPTVIPIVFQWRLFFTPEAHVHGAIAGVVCSIPLSLLAAAYVNRLRRLKIHLNEGSLHFGTYAISVLALAVSLYGWALLAQASTLGLQPTKELAYRIEALRYCSGKCGGCFYRIALTQWPGRENAELCFGKDFWESLKPGDEILLRGKFSNRAIYIESSTKSSGQKVSENSRDLPRQSTE